MAKILIVDDDPKVLKLLETLLRYYSLHLPGLKRIKSLEVLKVVFS